jgi:tetratricopeptide (TPR) repeat protein
MCRILLAATICVPLLVTSACESTSRVDSIHRMNEGIKQLNKGNLSGAQKAMEEAIQIDPSHSSAHMNLGKLQRKQEHWVDAEKAFEAAIQNMGEKPNGDFYLELALVQIAQGEEDDVSKSEMETQYRKAIGSLEEAIKHNPNLYKAHYQVGYLHEKLDEPENADQAYRACIKLNANYTPAFVSLGNMYIDYGFSAIAMSVLDAGTQVNDTDAAMWNGLGRAHLALNKPKEAVDAFGKAKAIDPEMPDVLFGLGMAYADLRMKTESADNLELFLKKANAQTPEHTQKAARDTLARMQDVI